VLGDADNVVAELLGIGLGHSWHPSRPPGRASQIRCHLLVHQPLEYAYGDMDWDEGYRYVDVATNRVKVKRAWVLVEVEL
ncbi:hypothetical protein, partial [Gordonia sp. CNJ-863]|uniref:hypothetical protein n=1 Tax=Gordonia sp. CNJ-863 TaxID=1904963 RepID=UPI001C9E8FB1